MILLFIILIHIRFVATWKNSIAFAAGQRRKSISILKVNYYFGNSVVRTREVLESALVDKEERR